MPAAACPGCGAEVATDRGPMLNEVLTCGTCRTELEVVTVSPMLLALAPDVEEDWGE